MIKIFEKIIEKYQWSKVTNYLVKAEFNTDLVSVEKDSKVNYFYKTLGKSLVKWLKRSGKEFRYINKQELSNLRKNIFYLDYSVRQASTVDQVDFEKIKNTILNEKNLKYKILEDSSKTIQSIFKSSLLVQVLKINKVNSSHRREKTKKLLMNPVFSLGVVFLAVFTFSILTVHFNIHTLKNSIVKVEKKENLSIESKMNYISVRNIKVKGTSFISMLKDLLYSEYMKKYSIFTKNHSQTFLVKTEKKDSRVYQYFSVNKNSKITVFINNKKLLVRVDKGSVYYFGKKGLSTSFQINDLNIKLLGTKVLFNKGHKNQDSTISVLEGSVSIVKDSEHSSLKKKNKAFILKKGSSFSYHYQNNKKNSLQNKDNWNSYVFDVDSRVIQATQLIEAETTSGRENLNSNQKPLSDSSTHSSYFTKQDSMQYKKKKVESFKSVKPVKKVYITMSKVYSDLLNYYNVNKAKNVKARIRVITRDKESNQNKITGFIKSINSNSIEIKTLFGVFVAKIEEVISYRKLNN